VRRSSLRTPFFKKKGAAMQNKKKQYTVNLAGKSISIMRVDIILSAKNTISCRRKLDELTLTEKECLLSLRYIRGLLTKDGRVDATVVGGGRFYDVHEAILQKVGESLSYETAMLFKKSLNSEEPAKDLYLPEDSFDFVPSTEGAVVSERSSDKVYYIYPVFFMGSGPTISYIENFLSEIASHSQAMRDVNAFISKLSIFPAQKEPIAESTISLIPPEFDTYSFIRNCINSQKAFAQK